MSEQFPRLNDANALATATQIGDVLGVSLRMVHHLEGEGVFNCAVQRPRKRYKLAESVRAYLRYSRETVKRQCSRNGDGVFEQARSRRMTALARVEELRARQLTGDMVNRSRVVLVMTSLLSTVRNHVLGIPSRCTRQIVGQRDMAKVRMILDEACRNCLREASSFGAHSFDEQGHKNAATVSAGSSTPQQQKRSSRKDRRLRK